MLSWYDFCLIFEGMAPALVLALVLAFEEFEAAMEAGKAFGATKRCSFSLLVISGILGPVEPRLNSVRYNAIKYGMGYLLFSAAVLYLL